MSGVASLRSARALGASRHATRVQFFCSGFLFATWGVHIPTIRALYGVTEAGLGVAMLAAGIGSQVELETSGEREQEAMDALLALINDTFGEGQ